MRWLHLSGATKNFDQNCLIHAIWKKLVELDTSIWIQRVPTKDNISDLPSRWPRFRLACLWGVRVLCIARREEYQLMRHIKAERVDPMLDRSFMEAQTWESLSVMGVFWPLKATT